MPHMSRRTKSMLLAALSLTPGVAAAVEPVDTFSASIGGYVTRFDTRIRADGELIDGTTIDLGRDLGLDKNDTIGFASVSWRPFERHEFGLSYFSNDTEADKRLERDIVFDDSVYRASATVHGRYDLDSVEAYYTWWGFLSENWALGPRVGLTWYQIELGVELELGVDGEPVGSGGLEDSVSADLPAPTLGASWRWTPAEDWRLLVDAGWLSTEINDIDGTIVYGRFAVEWHPWQRMGLVLDYTLSDIQAQTERRLYTGRLEMRNSGLRFGLVYRY